MCYCAYDTEQKRCGHERWHLPVYTTAPVIVLVPDHLVGGQKYLSWAASREEKLVGLIILKTRSAQGDIGMRLLGSAKLSAVLLSLPQCSMHSCWKCFKRQQHLDQWKACQTVGGCSLFLCSLNEQRSASKIGRHGRV